MEPSISEVMRVLPIVAAVALTPLLMTLWGRLFPPKRRRMFEDEESLRARNRWIDVVGYICCCGAMLLVLKLVLADANAVGWPVFLVSFWVV